MTVRLSKVAREFNVGLSTIVEFLQEKGIKISSDPNAKLSEEQYNLVAKEYSKDSEVRKEAKRMDLKTSRQKKETVTIDNINASPEGKKDPDFISVKDEIKLENKIKVVDRIDLSSLNKPKGETRKEESKPRPEKKKEEGRPKPEMKKEENRPKPEERKEKKEEPKPAEQQKQAPAPQPQKEVKPEPPKPEAKPAEKPAAQEKEEKPTPAPAPAAEVPFKLPTPTLKEVKVVGTIDLDAINQRTRPPKKSKQEREPFLAHKR